MMGSFFLLILSMMKTAIFSILCYFIATVTFSQNIIGKVIDDKSQKALEFVSIGIIDKPHGTITDENGEFKLELEGVSIDNKVRFSMIGFKAQVFTIKEILNKNKIIKLEEETIQLPEVVVEPSGRLREVGSTDNPLLKEVCGWGGTDFGKGHEIGSEMDLGECPVKLINLQLHLHKQSYDSTLLRLHIRSIIDNMPDKELLSENIIFSVSQESGWIDVDLSQYNIVMNQRIALSLEWIKTYGLNEDQFVILNKNKHPTPVVVFKVKRRKGSMYTRWGSEAKWQRVENKSPAFYLTVQE